MTRRPPRRPSRLPTAHRARSTREHASRQPPASPPLTRQCEVEVAPGLEEFARAELMTRFGRHATVQESTKPGNLPFTYTGELSELLTLRTAGSVYVVRRFPIPRPLALLGHQHLTALLGVIREVLDLHRSAAFQTFRISAAGEGSPVFDRLRNEIAAQTGLAASPEAGDLLLRVRRPSDGDGFEVSVRLSPRPLSARPWRVCDLPGALNASVARVMVGLTRPSPDDVFLNVVCGSGTLMAERLDSAPAREVIGADIDPEALRCARANLEAAGYGGIARLERWDAGQIPLPDASVTSLCGDLPFGHLVGSHRLNEELYPRVLAETARIAVSGARLVLLTSEARLCERALADHADRWSQERTIRFQMDNINLRAYVLVRKGNRQTS
ncbi:MAG: methyltransferase domain-containing protein [Chloroflexota bacterium]|nr:methyltransferase domain-containing protein [Chloroflexota bacterium]